ncbi:GPI ethanolamine phosphate transferase 1-like isoform X1 [Danaus plexippus]|uniref:GPI ethanolamine phosphate transferase 1-like isoform X1 n=1 Tax=Danaus plexippus TaxID=13037 RepID=UPI002AB15359|nr:GPI ethanolamine phosphate transferase 1-like isoform X1 [Danaus plexippus]
MFLLGLIVHIVFLFSIFDIYFKSPIVSHVKPYQPIHEAPADRLVLFVVDGLRAESFLNYTTMPYLRSVANTNGLWGISRTRVPTESRPGHVAILAGFYEDPSAVAKGWKQNPVDFDSVLNQSVYSWCWGTYDILEIFAKDDLSGHIYTEKMDPYDETYSPNRNTTTLDKWVFDRVNVFFNRQELDSEIYKKLQHDKILFFLHLLGTDSSGHMHKPKSQNFLTTIKFVDENIQEIEQIIRKFYKDDGRTAFLMTSDHGMTDWGSHGTGDDHETETPYVLWGAGVTQIESESIQLDNNYEMSLDNRHDINQADLTPLMSTLLSIPVPVNSIGQLPSELLNMTLPNKAKAIYSNCIQMISQYNKKRMDIESSAISFLYHPYEPLSSEKVEEILHVMEMLLAEEKYNSLISLCEDIMHLSLNGLSYYHNYYQKPLLITISLSFMGWIMFLLKVLLKQRINTQAEYSIASKGLLRPNGGVDIVIRTISILMAILAFYLIYAQNLPMQYYIYFVMPIVMWMYAVTPVKLWMVTLKSIRSKKTLLMLWFEIVCYTLGSLAMGFAFSQRWVLSIPLLGMSLWPFLSSKQNSRSTYIAWVAGCIMLSVFSFLPVVGKDVCIELVILAGLIWIIAVSFYVWNTLMPYYDKNNEIKREAIMSIIQITILAISLVIIFLQSKRFIDEMPISRVFQILCWNFSVMFPLLPLFYTKKCMNRLLGINTSILNFYLLLSVSHEGLFMVTLIFILNCWMIIEYKLIDVGKAKIDDLTFESDDTDNERNISYIERGINKQDFRRAFFFTLFIILAYFGTGNIASLNSFEVRWVLCFTTSFQPFVITTLILLKTLSPFLSVACTFRAIQIFTKAPVGCLNIIVLIFSNIMGIQMLFQVRNTGSWLEIGTSISQFVIVQTITLFIVLISQIAKIFTGTDLYGTLLKLLMTKKKYA